MADKFNELTSADFELVHENSKIHDVAFQTKPTTFLKDAVKRFCKNKSSIVAFGIIGFLVLLSIFVPIISDKNITVELRAISANLNFLKAKIEDLDKRVEQIENKIPVLTNELYTEVAALQCRTDEIECQTTYLFDKEPDIDNAIHHTRDFLSLGVSVNEFSESMRKLSEALAGFTGADTTKQKSDLEIFKPNSEIEDICIEEIKSIKTNSYDPWTMNWDEEPLIFVDDYSFYGY